MAQENERKWLVALEDIPREFFDIYPIRRIYQAYLTKGAIEMRVRSIAKSLGDPKPLKSFAIKTGGNTFSREEFEVKLHKKESYVSR
jgi:CYTH domain-containing protein